MRQFFKRPLLRNALIALSAFMFLPGCYNDDDLWDSVDDLDNRVTDIESRLNELNRDLATLKAVVEGDVKGAVITACQQTANGWTITLSDGRVIDLRNGIDGKDGADGVNGADGKDGADAPAVGIKADSDGVYYWTLTVDGTTDWLADETGNKMPVCGKDGIDGVNGSDGKDGVDGINGKDGYTPRLGVLNGYWTIDYGDGKGVMFMRDSDGNKIAVQGGTQVASLFSAVDVLDDEVVFTMSEGTTFSLVRIDNFGLSMDTSDPVFAAGQTRTYELVLTGVSDLYVTTVTAGWTARISGSQLIVSAPLEATEENVNCDVRLVVVNKRHDMRAFKLSVHTVMIVERVLTFEDADYKGEANFLGEKNWSSLIDSKQYGGSLLYPTNQQLYQWSDDNNTGLASEFVNSYGDYQFWGGGLVISNYSDMNLANGDYMHQLAVYHADGSGNGGHNGSKNFCVQNGYFDTNPEGLASGRKLPCLYFKDGKARQIKEMWVMNTTYVVNVWKNGNGLSPSGGSDGYFKLVAYAFDANGDLIDKHPELSLAQGKTVLSEWTLFDLSDLGEVSKIAFNLESNIDNGYGMSIPAYFAFDDVKVLTQAN